MNTQEQAGDHTHLCQNCGAKFRMDPVYCTFCESWDVEEVSDDAG